MDLVEIAEKRALKIATVKSSDLDLATPAGRMVASLLGSVAAYEGQQKAARQVAANRQRAQSGVVLWSRRPFGFDRDGSDVTIVESEAAEIRKAAAAVLSGATLASVAADLDSRGVTTSTGGQWTVTAVRRLLLNPRTAGRVVSKGEDFGGTAPAILDAQTFDQLGALLRDPARKAAPPSTAHRYLLSGMALCGRDGETMFATSMNAGVMVYRCRKCYLARRLDLVDEVVMGVLIERLSRPDAIDLLDSTVDVTALREQVVELRDRRDGLASLLADGLLTSEAVRSQAGKLTDQIDSLERQITAATGTDPLARLAQAGDVAKAIERMSLRELREAISALMIVRILPAGKGIRFSPESGPGRLEVGMTETFIPACTGEGSHGKITFGALLFDGDTVTEQLTRQGRAPWKQGTVLSVDGEQQDAPTRMIVAAPSARTAGADPWRWKCPACQLDRRMTTRSLIAWMRIQAGTSNYTLDISHLPR